MPKVFIVNDSGHDFSSAVAYGELVIMSEGELDKYAVTRMYRRFWKFLRDSKPTDYILYTGPGIMAAVACCIFAALHKRINLLIWRGEADGSERYVFRKLLLSEPIRKEQDARRSPGVESPRQH